MQSFKLTTILWLTALSLLTCSSSEHVNNDAGKDNTIDKKLLLELVNDIRTKGCQCGSSYYPPVTKVVWAPVLEEASLIHSKDMASKGYFSHKAQDGSMVEQRLERLNYNWQSYGENIFRTGGYSASEEQVIEAWKNSPGHCANLMGRHFKEMGVAEYNDYWTQVFGSRMQ